MNSPEKRTPQNGQMLVSGCADRDSWNTQLLYFTCSSLSRDDRRIYLLSDRSGDPNVVVRDLLTGETITGLICLAESLLLSAVVALGFAASALVL